MKELFVKITDPIWMHPGTATMFTDMMREFASVITITRGGEKGNAKEFFGVMKLKNLKGDITGIIADGPDEDAAIKAARKFFKEM